jgi:putative peptidoglycan lipid II flippase
MQQQWQRPDGRSRQDLQGSSAGAAAAPPGELVEPALTQAVDAPLAARSTKGRSVNAGVLIAMVSLASTTIAARVVGLVNQIVISSHFGAGAAMDAYFAAVAAPTLFTDLAVTALEYAVIPVYIRLDRAGREDEAAIVLSTLLNVVLMLLGCVTAAMVLLPRYTMLVFAPGVSRSTVAIGVRLLPLVAPTLMLNIAVGFITSMLNATGRFVVPALTTMLVPAGTIVLTLVLGHTYGVYALGTGLLLGTAAQALVVIALARQTKLRYRPVLHLRHHEVRHSLKQFVFMLGGSALTLANPVVDQIVASLLGTGGISWLSYALKIINVPVGVIFVAAARGIYPTLSNQAAARDVPGIKKTLRMFVWLVGLVSLGVSVVIVAFAGPIITIIFRHGAFTAHDARVTSAVLTGFAVGLCPMALGFMVPRVFGALSRNDVLLKVSVFTLALNALLDLALARVLGVPGIALGTSLDYLISTLTLIFVLRRLIGPLGLLRPPPELLHMRALLRSLLANIRGGAGQQLPGSLE